jgi:hypothetical protein
MNWLVESPWPILVAGAVLEVGLVLALVRTGRAVLLAAIAGVGLATALLLVVERMVITETERVENTLDDLSRTLLTNDLPAVLDFIAPSATDVRALAEHSLPEVKITAAHVGGDLEIQVNERASPPEALATFTGRFSFKLVRGTSPYENLVRHFRVKFVKQGERWLIVAVEESDLQRH